MKGRRKSPTFYKHLLHLINVKIIRFYRFRLQAKLKIAFPNKNKIK